MNILDTDQRAQILNCLVEGCSMRSTSRLTGAAKKTVERLLVAAGEACANYQNDVMRQLPCKLLQVDEVWSFCYAKDRNLPPHMRRNDEVGSIWTWIVLDSETKLIPSWRVGKRDSVDAWQLMKDLSDRLIHRVQLTTDGHTAYLQAVENVFEGDIDYAMLVKLYGQPTGPGNRTSEARYSPPQCIGARKVPIMGQPNRSLISTSHVERQNLSVRMGNRRFTRLTNAFSKKLDSHKHMLAIYFMAYNFCKPHSSLRIAKIGETGYIQQTPAMAANLTDHVWSLEEVASLI